MITFPTIVLNGNKVEAARFVRFGLKCLTELQNRMEMPEQMGLDPVFHLKRTISIPNGGNVFVQLAGNLSIVSIFMPLPVIEVEEIEEELEEISVYILIMAQVGYDNLVGGISKVYACAMLDITKNEVVTGVKDDNGADVVFPIDCNAVSWYPISDIAVNSPDYERAENQTLFSVFSNEFNKQNFTSGDQAAYNAGNGTYTTGYTYDAYSPEGEYVSYEYHNQKVATSSSSAVAYKACQVWTPGGAPGTGSNGSSESAATDDQEIQAQGNQGLEPQSGCGGKFSIYADRLLVYSTFNENTGSSTVGFITNGCLLGAPYYQYVDGYPLIEQVSTYDGNRIGFANGEENYRLVAPLGYSDYISGWQRGYQDRRITNKWHPTSYKWEDHYDFDSMYVYSLSTNHVDWAACSYYESTTQPLLNGMFQAYIIRRLYREHYTGERDCTVTVVGGSCPSPNNTYTLYPETIEILASVNNDVRLSTFKPSQQVRNSVLETMISDTIDKALAAVPTGRSTYYKNIYDSKLLLLTEDL